MIAGLRESQDLATIRIFGEKPLTSFTPAAIEGLTEVGGLLPPPPYPPPSSVGHDTGLSPVKVFGNWI